MSGIGVTGGRFRNRRRKLRAIQTPSCDSLDIEGLILSLQLEIYEFGAAIHYPECWDTMTYPTLLDALMEIGCSMEHEPANEKEQERR